MAFTAESFWRHRKHLGFTFVVLTAVVVSTYHASSHLETHIPANSVAALSDYSLLRYAPDVWGVPPARITVFNITDVEGSLWKSTRMVAELLLVDSGIIKDSCRFTMGANSGLLGSILWYNLNARLAICHVSTADGDFAFLTGDGMSAIGSGAMKLPKSPLAIKHSYERKVGWLTGDIVFVGGEKDPIVSPGMSVGSFVRNNRKGTFLVVVVRLAW